MERSREMARAAQDRDAAEANKKAAAAAYTDKIKTADVQIQSLARKISTGKEFREVECAWNYDWNGGRKFLIRQDTFDQIDVRSITDDERQQHFDIEAEIEDERPDEPIEPEPVLDEPEPEHITHEG